MSSAERYRLAGVDLDAAEQVKSRIAASVASTRTELAMGLAGAFGGMVKMPDDVPDPTLVLSTDGVGTKLLVAIRAGVHDTVGEDLVNHCVNDILVHGARPLAFLDYIASGSIDSETVAALVEGVARGCRNHDMVLVGGETAQMPDLYQPTHYDLAGTIVGVVSETSALQSDSVRPGDRLVGYASTGLHTNGYTLARRIIFEEMGLDIASEFPGEGRSVGEVLLAVHRSYRDAITPVIGKLNALAHITGGGVPGNLVRSLPDGCGAVVRSDSWDPPALFRALQQSGRVPQEEMFRVFNMGVGMIAVVPSEHVDEARAAASAAAVDNWVLGQVIRGEGVAIE